VKEFEVVVFQMADPHGALRKIAQHELECPLTDAALAVELDRRDELAPVRSQFLFPLCRPEDPTSPPALYFCGNSLGLQPVRTRAYIDYELDEWSKRGVEGHHFHSPFEGKGKGPVRLEPWLTVDENVHARMARLVGALPLEVAIMNGLTVNLHLMMVSFYRPTPQRHKILIEGRSFPSDWVWRAIPPLLLSSPCRWFMTSPASMRWRRRSGSTGMTLALPSSSSTRGRERPASAPRIYLTPSKRKAIASLLSS